MGDCTGPLVSDEDADHLKMFNRLPDYLDGLIRKPSGDRQWGEQAEKRGV